MQSKLLGGCYIGVIYGTTIRVIKGDTRSLDIASYRYIGPELPIV